MPSPSTSEEFLPPVIFAGLIGICYLISVGANDAANALGTAVGSGALSLQKAMIIGAIFELLGATLVGGRTSSSLGEKFLTIDTFTNIEYAYAMFSALFGGAVWNFGSDLLFVACVFNSRDSGSSSIYWRRAERLKLCQLD